MWVTLKPALKLSVRESVLKGFSHGLSSSQCVRAHYSHGLSSSQRLRDDAKFATCVILVANLPLVSSGILVANLPLVSFCQYSFPKTNNLPPILFKKRDHHHHKTNKLRKTHPYPDT